MFFNEHVAKVTKLLMDYNSKKVRHLQIFQTLIAIISLNLNKQKEVVKDYHNKLKYI